MDKVGNAIKERRKILKITQRTLAELAGVGINTLTKMSAERRESRSKFLKKILDTLGLELQIGIKQRNELRTILKMRKKSNNIGEWFLLRSVGDESVDIFFIVRNNSKSLPDEFYLLTAIIASFPDFPFCLSLV